MVRRNSDNYGKVGGLFIKTRSIRVCLCSAKNRACFKDKTQQSWLFTCLTAHIKQTFLTQISTLSQEEEYFFVKLQNSALEATKKWQANVSFQNVCEQLATKITK